jgi:predicted nucleotidyltransferase
MRRVAQEAPPIAGYAAGLVGRIRREFEQREREAGTIRQRVTEATRALVARFEVRRVWLFGSLAWGGVHEESDVDLLVEGLTADLWDDADAFLEERIGLPVDLVRREEAPPGLVERVRAMGVLLYDRS